MGCRVSLDKDQPQRSPNSHSSKAMPTLRQSVCEEHRWCSQLGLISLGNVGCPRSIHDQHPSKQQTTGSKVFDIEGIYIFVLGKEFQVLLVSVSFWTCSYQLPAFKSFSAICTILAAEVDGLIYALRLSLTGV